MRIIQTTTAVIITLISGVAGWQLCWFLMIYTTGNTTHLETNLVTYMTILPYFAGVGFLLSAALPILSFFQKIPAVILNSAKYKRLIMVQLGYFVLLMIDSWWYRAGYHVDIFELLIAPIGIWLIYNSGSIYFHSGKRMYNHPTTIGSVFVKSALIGLSLIILYPVNGADTGIIPGILPVLILLDLFILVAQFRYLSQSGEETHRIARKLLAEYIFLFGARIIIGIFIPLVIILYSIYLSNYEYKGTAALLILGVVLHTLVLTLAGRENGKESTSASGN